MNTETGIFKSRIKLCETYNQFCKGPNAEAWLLHQRWCKDTGGSLRFFNTFNRTRRLKAPRGSESASPSLAQPAPAPATLTPLLRPTKPDAGKGTSPNSAGGSEGLPPTSAHLLPGMLWPKSGSCSASTPKLAIITVPTRLGANSRDTSCSLPFQAA